MMIVIASNSIVRQNVGARGMRRKRWEVEEREDRQEFQRQARTLPQVQLGQGYQMRGTGENMDGGVRFTLQEGQRGLRISPIVSR